MSSRRVRTVCARAGLGCLLACALAAASACKGSDSPTGHTGDAPTPAVGAVLFTAVPPEAVVGTTVAVQVRVEDTWGRPMARQSVAFSASAGTVTPSTGSTDAGGLLAASWTLGTAAGSQTLTAVVSGKSASVSITALAAAAALLEKVAGDAQTGVVGAPLPHPLVVAVKDAFGNPVPGVTVTFSPAAASGSVAPAAAITGSEGRASTLWTLGATAGTQSVTAAGPGALAATFTATATPGAASALVATEGDNQTAPAGSPVPVRPTVKAVDPFGNGVSGLSVTFAVASGGGSVSGENQTTGSDGTASVGSWTLGPTPGVNTLRAFAPGLAPVTFTANGTGVPTGFDIQIRVVGSMSAAVQGAFAAAEAKWESVITGDLPDVFLTSAPGECAFAPAVRETVDDLVIYARVGPVDGPGKTLGAAGPCWIRSGSALPVLGIMEFDEADMASLAADGLLGDVVLHEMGHVLGFGTVWEELALLQDKGSTDPYFSGPGAKAAYAGLGATLVNGVPVENTGDEGTRDAHWRETVFRTELMTGWISRAGNPLSLVTVRSMGDLGYTVNAGAADPYILPPPSPARVETGTIASPWERLLMPRGTVTPEGVRGPLR